MAMAGAQLGSDPMNFYSVRIQTHLHICDWLFIFKHGRVISEWNTSHQFTHINWCICVWWFSQGYNVGQIYLPELMCTCLVVFCRFQKSHMLPEVVKVRLEKLPIVLESLRTRSSAGSTVSAASSRWCIMFKLFIDSIAARLNNILRCLHLCPVSTASARWCIVFKLFIDYCFELNNILRCLHLGPQSQLLHPDDASCSNSSLIL